MPRRVLPYALAGWMGAVSAYLYGVQVVQPGWNLAAELHRQIIDGSAASPYRSRVLLPFIAEGLSTVMGLEPAYLLLYFVLLPLAFCALFALLRRWYPTTLALLGTGLAATAMPLALRDHYFQPATWLELVLVIVALRVLDAPRLDLRLYGAVAVVATLNRETGVLLGLLLVVVAWPDHPARRTAIAFTAAVPVAVYDGIRLWRGGGPPAEHDLLDRNLHDLPTAVVQIALFAAVVGFLALTARAAAPVLFRRALWIVPPYLALIAAFGIWREARLLVPLLPILLGAGLSALRLLDEDDQESSTTWLMRRPEMNSGTMRTTVSR